MRRRREHGDPDETFTKSDDGVGVSPIAVGGDDCGGSSDTVRPEDLQNVPGPARIVEHDDGAGVGSVRRHAVPEHRPPGGRADGGRQAQRKVERVTVGIEGKAACGVDGVRYPSTDTKLVNTRMQYRTVDMHDDDRRKRRGPRIA